MAATASAPPALSPTGADGLEPEDSNISSPLSEVDDKDANDEDLNMHLGEGDENDSSLTAEGQAEVDHDGSDSESALSDARSVAQSDGNDTEAETERLHDTPHNRRQRDVIVDQYNEGQIFEHSPSKLRTTAAIEPQDDQADNDSIPDDGASSVSEKSEAAESTSKIGTTKDTSVDDEPHLDSQDRKRKRSPATDLSEPEQPMRKRTGSVGAVEEEADQDAAEANEDDTAVANDLSAQVSVAEDEAPSPQKREASGGGTPTERETRASRKATRTSSRNKVGAVEADDDTTTEAPDEPQLADGEDEQEQQTETVEADVEDEADAAAKSAEEGNANNAAPLCHQKANAKTAEKKLAAYKDWSRIEEMFGVFRDRYAGSSFAPQEITYQLLTMHRLYKDRLQRLEEEEQTLLADDPTHPEYLNMKKCLDDRLNRKIQEIEKENELRLEAHKRRFVAVRAQIWSQFVQGVREKRESTLATLNKEWYDVQTARRNAHSLQEYGMLFPKDPTQRVRNAVAYNNEVSTLAGLAKFEGFPAGPEIRGASTSELNDDLGAIEVSVPVQSHLVG